MLNPAYAPSNNPFGRGSARPIGRIHRSHAVGGANGTHHGGDVCGGVVSVIDGILVLFLQ